MKEELQVLADQSVWTVVPLPAPRHNIVGCKWVYKIKRDTLGNISRYKARLVAQGFSQQPGMDIDWPQLDQLDIKGAFLYGSLNEEIYMKLPPGYEKLLPGTSEQPDQCARLHRSIYSLKQSPRQRYQRLTGFLIPLGYVTTNFDPCVLIHVKLQVIMAIYVDDITLAGSNSYERKKLMESLKKEFNLSELGPLSWLLGIQIDWHTDFVTLSQHAYIDQLLLKFGMNACNPVSLPLEPHKYLLRPKRKMILQTHPALGRLLDLLCIL